MTEQDVLIELSRLADAAERIAKALEEIGSVIGRGDNGRMHVRTYDVGRSE